MRREYLISLASRYAGDYFKIVNAINSKEDIEIVDIKNALTIFDLDYPKELMQLKYPPLVLFYKGDLNLLKEYKIGIVGSRKPCDYAIEATRLLALKNNDKVIVSGLAKGIDGIAHKYSNKSIGILGCGINYIYPKENAYLYKELEEKGLILSEYPNNTLPYGRHFPFRNRIIAALSESIYVMQSSLKSGTMSTINEALELGKDIKVLPFDIFNELGRHNNTLINEGAQMIEFEEIDISNPNMFI